MSLKDDLEAEVAETPRQKAKPRNPSFRRAKVTGDFAPLAARFSQRLPFDGRYCARGRPVREGEQFSEYPRHCEGDPGASPSLARS